MADTRHKDTNWTINIGVGGRVNWGGAQLAVMMDIRDELKRLNSLLHCTNFIAIPRYLREVRRNTANLPKVPKKAKQK